MESRENPRLPQTDHLLRTYNPPPELTLELTQEVMYTYYMSGRRDIDERNIRKITKTGRGQSFSVTLPIEFVRQLKWREKQKVVIKKSGSKLIIEDWKK